MEFCLATINGRTGIVASRGDRALWALSLDTDGRHIVAGYNVINPDKLARLKVEISD